MTDFTNEEAMSFAYIAMGYAQVVPYLETAPSALLDMGEDQLFDEHLGPMAGRIEQIWQDEPQDDWDGVWYYDVSQPMGGWAASFIALHHRVPTNAEIDQATRTLQQRGTPTLDALPSTP